jgi:hypothetical protein
MRYGVRELDASNRQAVLRLWQDSLSPETDFVRKLAWFYEEAPAGPGTVLVLYDELGAAIGATGIGRRQGYLEGEPCVLALNADFAIAHGHRTVLPALALQRESRRRSRVTFSLSYGLPNEAAVGVFDRIGYHRLDQEVCRFARILHHEKYVRRLLNVRPASASVGRLLDWLMGLGRGPRLASVRLSHQLEWQSVADSRFDRLSLGAAARFPVFGDRSARFLNWRFRDKPGRPFDLVTLRRPGSQELVAYAVIEQKNGVAAVHDLLAAEDRDASALLELSASALARRGCDSMWFTFLGPRRMVDLLKGAGFHPRESRPLVADTSESSAWGSSLVRDAENWYITDADVDTDT